VVSLLASDGFRRTINPAVIGGDGIGKPMGILHPNAGIPICDTAPNTPGGDFYVDGPGRVEIRSAVAR